MLQRDFSSVGVATASANILQDNRRVVRPFLTAKRGFDVLMSIVLLPVLVLMAAILLVLNPFLNKGPLIFVQTRMGHRCKPFRAYKFRSMTEADRIARGPNDAHDTHRITVLGAFIRKSRIDELPQIINVLRGEMSLIGPRPDYIHHARHYLRCVPGYRDRHAVRPGISGYAQTELGYVQNTEGTVKKVEADLYYIENMGPRLEFYVFWRTLTTILGRKGQ